MEKIKSHFNVMEMIATYKILQALFIGPGILPLFIPQWRYASLGHHNL